MIASFCLSFDTDVENVDGQSLLMPVGEVGPELVGCEYSPVHVYPSCFEAHVLPHVHEDDGAEWERVQIRWPLECFSWGLRGLFTAWGYVDHVVSCGLCCANVEEADLAAPLFPRFKPCPKIVVTEYGPRDANPSLAAGESHVFPAVRNNDRAGHKPGEVLGAVQLRDAVADRAIIVGVELDCCHLYTSPLYRRTTFSETESRIHCARSSWLM